MKILAVLALCAVAVSARADQVVMQNGDRYNGKVLSVTTNSLVLQSDVLGTVTLSRGKVTLITLGSGTATNVSRPSPPAAISSRAPSVTPTNLNSELSAAFRQLGTQSNLIQQVQSQFLGTASPEANDKFNQMMSGLISGQMTVGDLRAEAKSTADQLRSLKKDLGADAGSEVDGYLAILDSFLGETGPSGDAMTNATTALPKPKSKPASASQGGQ
jgi:hypothetical protein